MDQTHMQQTVKESVEYGVSNPQETDISTKQPEITNNDERAYEPLSYDVVS